MMQTKPFYLCLSLLACLTGLIAAPCFAQQTVLWHEEFSDGVLNSWAITNPHYDGDDPITIEASDEQWTSSPYSLKVHGPQYQGASGSGLGPEVLYDPTQPFTIEFSFRYDNFHWYHLMQFGPVHLYLDYPSLPLGANTGPDEWNFIGSDPFNSICPANTWTRFRVEVDPASHTYDVYVDDAMLGTVDYGEHDTGRRGFAFRETSGGSGNYMSGAYYDDLAISGSILPVAWIEDFDDGEISDWEIRNPHYDGDDPITIEVSDEQSVSPEYSLKVHGPQYAGASGSGLGPEVVIDLEKPYTLEFSFRYTTFHWYHLAQFGPVHLYLDYPSLPLGANTGPGEWNFIGSEPFSSACPPDTWVRFRVEVDPESHSYDVYVDDVMVGTVDYGDHDTGRRGFAFRETSGGSGNYLSGGYYDDLMIAGLAKITGVGDDTPSSSDHALRPCYPNPFNPQTTLRYELATSATVDLRIYDLSGRLVSTLKNGVTESAGRHETVWRGTDSADRVLPAGVYLCVLRADGAIATQSVVLIK